MAAEVDYVMGPIVMKRIERYEASLKQKEAGLTRMEAASVDQYKKKWRNIARAFVTDQTNEMTNVASGMQAARWNFAHSEDGRTGEWIRTEIACSKGEL